MRFQFSSGSYTYEVLPEYRFTLDTRVSASPFRPFCQQVPCRSLQRARATGAGRRRPWALPALTQPLRPPGSQRLPPLLISDQNSLQLRCTFSKLSQGSQSMCISIWICLILISNKTSAFRISSSKKTLVPLRSAPVGRFLPSAELTPPLTVLSVKGQRSSQLVSAESGTPGPLPPVLCLSSLLLGK